MNAIAHSIIVCGKIFAVFVSNTDFFFLIYRCDLITAALQTGLFRPKPELWGLSGGRKIAVIVNVAVERK